MSGNSFGTIFKITTFGESHGGAVGVVIDGVTPNLPITSQEIQKELDRRKPGQSQITTPRQEADTVNIMSGVFNGKTTGTPILLIIHNKDARPEAYDNIKNLFRPGHADYTFQKKFGIRDYCGSGRASGRETVGRVAAGAIAKKLLAKRGVTITAYTKQVADIKCQNIDFSQIEQNIARAADSQAAKKIVQKILQMQKKQDSVGGIVECQITGLPVGLGEPVFDKLDADLAKAIISIGAVKGIEFGKGFQVATMTGKENNDEMDEKGFKTNNAGGILGGISSGQTIIFRLAVKPTSSLAQSQQTVDINNNPVQCITEGRHDPCILPRIIPVVEAMTALVLEDHFKRQTALHA